MKYLFILFTFFYFTTTTAQDFTTKKFVLEWEENKVIHTDKSKVWRMPVVKNQGADFRTMLPTFSIKWEVPNNSSIENFEISNPVFENSNSKTLQDTKKENVVSELQTKVFTRTTRDKTHVFIELNPLIKDGGVYKKLKSFTLNYKLGAKPISKSTSTVSNSVLATGTWYKFSTTKTGVYKINRSFLEDLGIDTGSINPQNISVYGNGGVMLPYRIGDFRQQDLAENGIYVHGEADGNFDDNDYILFYAKGPDDFVHNNTIESLKHRINIFANKAYYFIHVGSSLGKRISNATIITTAPTVNLTNYDDIIFHEKEERNISEMGQQWQGEAFHVENVQHFNMNFDNIDTSHPLRIKTRSVATSSASTTVTATVNGNDLYSFSISPSIYSGTHLKANYKEEQDDITVTSGNLDIRLTYNAIPSSKTYLDYIEVKGKKILKANTKQFGFRNFESIGNITSYNIQNESNIHQIWNVTDNTTPQIITNQGSGSNFYFVANSGVLNEYTALIDSDYYIPELLENSIVENQNLHSLENVDYIIITRDFLVDEAEEIAKYHREHSGLNVKTIPLYQIYNEFGSGTPDITAIRDFVKHLYDNSTPQLQYVLLYGDASYDYQNIEEKGENIVPSFEYYRSFNITSSYVTDDFFGIVSDDDEGDIEAHESSNTQDVAVSRIPIRSEAEACAVTSKILNYYNTSTFGDWRNKVVMMADDISHNSWESAFQDEQEILSDNIKLSKPLFNIKKLYADSFPLVVTAGGGRYPALNTAFDNAIENGVLMMDYYGHGGEDGLADERLLGTDQIRNWNNTNTLPLFVVISCEFARFDNPNRPNTAGELTIRNPHGGVAHQIATARAITTTTGEALNNDIVPRLLEFDGISYSVSENLRLTKNENHGRSQRMFVFSFGDPALHLAVPKPNIKITHMNDTPVSESLDTIKALSHVYFKGVVTDNLDVTLSDYNGTMAVTIYDKEIDKETLGNGIAESTITFDTRESKIFRGQASVTNGVFSFDFVAPRDLRIAYGKGKLSLYADNQNFDKGGYNIDVEIGGVNEDAPEDNSPPSIRIYMDNESFIDGGDTNKNPLFLAFFEDENGINTSITAVDHDIVATVDEDNLNTIILNDYYNTELDDFTKGSLKYTLRNLEPGEHSIHLKAFDTYNNKSEATLNFVVIDDSELVLSHVLNYPNPFVSYTEFWFNHNKPNEPLEAQIQVFTVSGKLVKTINQFAQYSCDGVVRIPWNGLDDFGEKIGKGVYIYKLKVRATLSGVEAEKIEKLVILQ